MSLRLLIGLALAVALLGLLPASALAVPVPRQQGMTVAEWGRGAYAPKRLRVGMRRLHALGVNTIALDVAWSQPGPAATTMRPSVPTVPTARLVRTIRAAHRQHLRVLLRPYLMPADGSWRGDIRPASAPEWFTNYTRFMRRYARLASREKVEGLVVGTEMVSMSGYEAEWRALVEKIRQDFPGFLTYQANWGEESRVTWWDAVDVIAISAYYPLIGGLLPAAPTIDELMAGWTPWFQQIEALHQRFGRDVMFGEIGYRPLVESPLRPWDVLLTGSRSAKAQATAYEAAFRVWQNVSWFRGFVWWRVPADVNSIGKSVGDDHQPLAPARAVLRRWYR